MNSTAKIVVEPKPSPPKLSEIEVVLVNSRAALAHAYHMGLSTRAEVRSTAPALILDPEIKAISMEETYGPSDVQDLYDRIVGWTRAIYDALRVDPVLSDLSLLTARGLFRLQTAIFKCMTLREADFHRPIAVVEIATPRSENDWYRNAPWTRILARNPQFVPIRVPKEALGEEIPYWAPMPNLADRLRFSDWQSMAYRASQMIWERMPFRSPRGTILVLNEGDLLKESAFHLARHGFGIRRLPTPKPSPPTFDDGAAKALEERLVALLKERLAPVLAPSALALTVELISELLVADVPRYRASIGGWRKTLDSLSSFHPRAVLANKISNLEGTALCEVCRERGLLTVVFQHGVTREISRGTDRFEAMYETTSADTFFTFSAASAEVTNASPLVRGKAIAVGMDRSYRRAARMKASRSHTPPIWYVSTALYIGNWVPALNKGETDEYMARFELALIDEVFSRLPHGVLYKPYTHTRYPDPDPVIERAESAANIVVYRGRQDLRYLVANSRVLVTSRATSTLSWCLSSGKPVVFLDVPQQPLNSAARAAIEKGLFLIDGGSPDASTQLRELLSQPIEEIERRWAARSTQDRAAMLATYFNSGGWRAGATAARLLVEADFRPDQFRCDGAPSA